MPAQKRPEQRSAASKKPGADQSQAQPTGEETYSAPGPQAQRPPRETGNDQGETEAGASERKGYVDENVSKLQEVAAEYFNKLGDTASDLTVQARKVYSNSRDYVGEHPGSTVGGAFLVGCLIGFLMDRD